MAKIDWDSAGKRFYNAGLDRSVLYTYGNPGVPWFGLYAIEEGGSGASLEPYYIDGFKYLLKYTDEEFTATLNALQYPPEFEVCDGYGYMAQGLYASQQERQPFGLSYRTLIGSDTVDPGWAYKIHVMYRMHAQPSSRTHITLHGEASMETYSWETSSLPYRVAGMKPVSKLVVDSRLADPDALETLEDILYGTDGTDPLLPDPGQMMAILSGEEVSFDEDV